MRAQNQRLKGEVGRHKAELESLKERDPEFFKFLQETDAELLEFGEDGEDEGGSESDSEEQEPAPAAESEEVSLSHWEPCNAVMAGSDEEISALLTGRAPA